MSLREIVRRWMGKPSTPAAAPAPPRFEEEPEPVVPEMDAAELRAALDEAAPPLVLDVREPYEWRQVRIPAALHIPMNEVPANVARLPSDRRIVVVCAHGNRSYGVTAWLQEQGYAAANLRGGIAAWGRQGGTVEQGTPPAG